MFFETEEIELPEGLETADTIVSIKSDINHRLKIPVISNSKQDIFISKNTIVCSLQQISYISPLQVKRKPDISIIQSNLNKDEIEKEVEQGNNDMTLRTSTESFG